MDKETKWKQEIYNNEFLKNYLKELQLLPILSNNEMINLFNEYQNGNKVSYFKLINYNLKLVVFIAKKFINYTTQTVDIMDLIQVGNIGLIKAINTFNPSKNVKLSGYIGRIIYQEIITYISEKSKSFRYSPKLLNINLETVKILKMNIKNPTSINELIKINNDSFIEKIDTIQDNSVDAVDEQVIKSIENERLIRYLNYLDKMNNYQNLLNHSLYH